MQLILATAAVLATLDVVSAHASINKPKPILFDQQRGTYNAPLKPDYSDFPCKGYHNQPFNAVETWVAGQEASFVVDMGQVAAHGGGSCQASLSRDGGKSFQVIHSFIGDCPRAANGNTAGPNQEFKFMVPKDEPAGDAIFAWTWFAAIANREMYMNCAYITIENNSGARQASARPNIFVGLLAPGACQVGEQTNLDFPDPGQFVTDGSNNADAQYKGKTKPSGSDCGNAASGGGETIKNTLPPNNGLRGPVAGPKPGPANPPPKNANPVPSPVMATTAAPQQPAIPTGGPEVVYVTELVTSSIVDIVTITATSYLLPEATHRSQVRRSDTFMRDASSACQFQATFKVGDHCPVPSTKSSQWKDCIWRDFCSCLDNNLSPTDIVNFSQIKGHCDCVTKGIGCSAVSRSRERRRHLHTSRMDMILPSENMMAYVFKV
ncbi:hypothetical protein DRE_04314 [Drechslerella stenobrocha 248]|uniref:Lytic polysaccharide monooxygenase n=1 Tax=Drechslerella stenobrocha 248 TaxID=1043628 RepID=W7HQD5_9PEZI|nr:hypothetical protein DRE_04314 [Drechslerella stenobrocha 248]